MTNPYSFVTTTLLKYTWKRSLNHLGCRGARALLSRVARYTVDDGTSATKIIILITIIIVCNIVQYVYSRKKNHSMNWYIIIRPRSWQWRHIPVAGQGRVLRFVCTYYYIFRSCVKTCLKMKCHPRLIIAPYRYAPAAVRSAEVIFFFPQHDTACPYLI